MSRSLPHKSCSSHIRHYHSHRHHHSHHHSHHHTRYHHNYFHIRFQARKKKMSHMRNQNHQSLLHTRFLTALLKYMGFIGIKKNKIITYNNHSRNQVDSQSRQCRISTSETLLTSRSDRGRARQDSNVTT